jgi:glycogen operon protein
MLSDLGYRLTGSSDLYQHNGRKPFASINFITAHDGFTLNDLVSYNDKHNEANGENNCDGANDNHSWNMGAEGPTDDPEINELRERQMRNLMATLLLSQGVPMICGGDELCRTQHGNNNAYCQDNEISWTNWQLDERKETMLEFTRRLIDLRLRHPNLHRERFFQDRGIRPSDREVRWLRPDGHDMADDEWGAGWVRCLGMLLNGDTLQELDNAGRQEVDDTFLLMLNPHWEPIDFFLPEHGGKVNWCLVLDTRDPKLDEGGINCESGQPYHLIRQSLALFKLDRPESHQKEVLVR